MFYVKLENLENLELRIKLSDEYDKLLWDEVEKTGISDVSEKTDTPPHRIYNWRSRESFLPVSFVSYFLEEPDIKAFKGKGSSKPVKNFKPSLITDELLTRVEESVSVNCDGVPFYQNADIGCSLRFLELLKRLGDFDVSTYKRDVYEVRYPKHLHALLSEIKFEPDLTARVDESGEIVDGKVVLSEKELGIQDIEGQLYSKEKKYRLAVEKEESADMAEIISAESERTRFLDEEIFRG